MNINNSSLEWEDKPVQAPSPSLKPSRALITKSLQLAAFSPSSTLGRKGSNIGQLQPRELLEDSLGTEGIQADESHTNSCVLFGITAAFSPSVAEMLQHCSMKEGSVRCGREGPFAAKGGVAGSHHPFSRVSESEGS